MSDDTTQHDAELDPAKWEDLHQDMENAASGLVLRRLIEDEERMLKEISDRHKRILQEDREKSSNYSLVEEISTDIASNTKENLPDLHRDVEQEISNVDISDLLAALTPQDHDSTWSSYTTPQRAAVIELRDSEELQDILRHQRYIEEQIGPPEGQPPLEERLDQWVKSGHAKKALQYGKYAVMAGMLVAAPPMAATMAGSMIMRRTVLPHAMKAGEKLQQATEKYLVDQGTLSQEQIDNGKSRMNEITQKVTGSKVGRFGLAVGALALIGASSAFALDVVEGEELGTRFGKLWESGKDLADSIPGIDGAASEITDEAIQSAEAVSAAPDQISAEAIQSAEAVSAAPDQISAEAIQSAEAVADMPPESSLVHPEGGLSRDALAERLAGAGETELADMVSSLKTETLDVGDLHSAVSSLGPEEAHRIMSGGAGIDLAEVTEAASAAPPELSTFNQSPGDVMEGSGKPSGMESGPGDPATPGGGESAEAGPGGGESVEAGPGGGESAEAGPGSNVVSTTHDVVVGDTLSEAVYDAYQSEGVNLSASELYGPSEYTDHPGGIIGEVADKNGYANPDLIYPGDSIQVDVQTAPGAGPAVAPEVSEQAIESATAVAPEQVTPEISEQAIESATAVAPEPVAPEISEQAIESASIVGGESPEVSEQAIAASSEIAANAATADMVDRAMDGDQLGGAPTQLGEADNASPVGGVIPTEIKDAAKDNWLTAAAGALGVTAAVAGVTRLFSRKTEELPEEPHRLTHTGQEKPGHSGSDQPVMLESPSGEGSKVDSQRPAALDAPSEEKVSEYQPDPDDGAVIHLSTAAYSSTPPSRNEPSNDVAHRTGQDKAPASQANDTKTKPKESARTSADLDDITSTPGM